MQHLFPRKATLRKKIHTFWCKWLFASPLTWCQCIDITDYFCVKHNLKLIYRPILSLNDMFLVCKQHLRRNTTDGNKSNHSEPGVSLFLNKSSTIILRSCFPTDLALWEKNKFKSEQDYLLAKNLAFVIEYFSFSFWRC